MACVVIEVKHLSSDKYTNTTEDANIKKHTYKYANTGTPIQTYNSNTQIQFNKYKSHKFHCIKIATQQIQKYKHTNSNENPGMAEIEIFAMMTWSAAAVS